MTVSGNDRETYLRFDRFNPDEYRISRRDNIGGGRVSERTGERMVFDLRTDQGRADASEVTNRDSQSSITSTLVDAALGAVAGITERQISDRSEPQPLRRGLDTSALALLEIAKNNKTTKVIVPDPAPAPSKPIVGLVELTKATAAPGIKPATPGTAIDPAAAFPGLVDDVSREARENRAYDLLFGENAFTRFSAGIGYGPFTPQEAMALRFFAARHSEELQQLRDLHGEGALRIAARAIIDVLQGNAGQILPQQHIIDAHFNAALNLALHPDYLHQEFGRASRVEMFGQIYDYFEDQFYRNPSLSSNARAAFIESVTYEIEFFIDVAEAVPYADRPALMEVISEVLGEQVISDNKTGRYRQPRWPVAPVGGRA